MISTRVRLLAMAAVPAAVAFCAPLAFSAK